METNRRIVEFILVFTVVLMQLTCGGLARNIAELPDMASFISFEIELEKPPSGIEGIKVNQIIKNISEREIAVTEPTCPGAVSWIFGEDSLNNRLPIQIEVKPICPDSKDRLLPKGALLNIPFSFTLEKCFNLDHPGLYYIWLEYYGCIYDPKGPRIANDKPIKSNRLIIEVN